MRIGNSGKIVVILVIELFYDLCFIINGYTLAKKTFYLDGLITVTEKIDEHLENYWCSAWSNLL
jgi:hypothetical protein